MLHATRAKYDSHKRHFIPQIVDM